MSLSNSAPASEDDGFGDFMGGPSSGGQPPPPANHSAAPTPADPAPSVPETPPESAYNPKEEKKGTGHGI